MWTDRWALEQGASLSRRIAICWCFQVETGRMLEWGVPRRHLVFHYPGLPQIMTLTWSFSAISAFHNQYNWIEKVCILLRAKSREDDKDSNSKVVFRQGQRSYLSLLKIKEKIHRVDNYHELDKGCLMRSQKVGEDTRDEWMKLLFPGFNVKADRECCCSSLTSK